MGSIDLSALLNGLLGIAPINEGIFIGSSTGSPGGIGIGSSFP